jgi:26S proteasome regulatory subunit T5
MSTLEELDDWEREDKDKKKDQGEDGKKQGQDGDAEMQDADQKKDELEDIFDEEILRSSTRDIINRRKLLENDMRIMKSEFQRLTHEQNTMKEKIKDNVDKIENNRYGFNLPYWLLFQQTDLSSSIDNYLTSWATSWNCWILMSRRKLRKKAPI